MAVPITKAWALRSLVYIVLLVLAFVGVGMAMGFKASAFSSKTGTKVNSVGSILVLVSVILDFIVYTLFSWMARQRFESHELLMRKMVLEAYPDRVLKPRKKWPETVVTILGCWGLATIMAAIAIVLIFLNKDKNAPPLIYILLAVGAAVAVAEVACAFGIYYHYNKKLVMLRSEDGAAHADSGSETATNHDLEKGQRRQQVDDEPSLASDSDDERNQRRGRGQKPQVRRRQMSFRSDSGSDSDDSQFTVARPVARNQIRRPPAAARRSQR